MELKDIKELMKVLKNEEMSELKVRYGKIKLTLTNSGQYKEEPKIDPRWEKLNDFKLDDD